MNKTWENYNLDSIPQWCTMPLDCHFDNMGGCWGISHGVVTSKGEEHCRFCQFNLKNANKSEQELLSISSSVLRTR